MDALETLVAAVEAEWREEAPPRDRKTSREFYASKPGRTLACTVQGCPKRFRPSTNYSDFLVHFNARHGKGK